MAFALLGTCFRGEFLCSGGWLVCTFPTALLMLRWRRSHTEPCSVGCRVGRRQQLGGGAQSHPDCRVHSSSLSLPPVHSAPCHGRCFVVETEAEGRQEAGRKVVTGNARSGICCLCTQPTLFDLRFPCAEHTREAAPKTRREKGDKKTTQAPVPLTAQADDLPGSGGATSFDWLVWGFPAESGPSLCLTEGVLEQRHVQL